MNVLFIGNSYTYFHNMPQLFEKLAKENGKDVTACAVTSGGRHLYENLDNADDCAAQIKRLAENEQFDVCFLQEHSIGPLVDEAKFLYGITGLMQLLKNTVKQFVLYETWGRKEGSDTLQQYGWTHASMTESLVKAYETAATKVGAKVSPVGACFHEVLEKYPQMDLYDSDFTHPSYLGSCLIALTHYYTLFGEFPQSTTTLCLSMTEIAAFQQISCFTVMKNAKNAHCSLK